MLQNKREKPVIPAASDLIGTLASIIVGFTSAIVCCNYLIVENRRTIDDASSTCSVHEPIKHGLVNQEPTLEDMMDCGKTKASNVHNLASWHKS